MPSKLSDCAGKGRRIGREGYHSVLSTVESVTYRGGLFHCEEYTLLRQSRRVRERAGR